MDKEREEMKALVEQIQHKMQAKFGVLPIDLIQTLHDIKEFINSTKEKPDTA